MKRRMMAVMVAMVVVVGLAGCASRPPAWVSRGAGAWSAGGGSKDHLYGAGGVAGVTDRPSAYLVADMRAREDLAKALEVKVQALAKDYLDIKGKSRGTPSADVAQAVSRALIERVQVVVRGAEVVDRWEDLQRKEVWSLVALPRDAVQAQILQAVPEEDRPLVRDRARQMFEELNEQEAR